LLSLAVPCTNRDFRIDHGDYGDANLELTREIDKLLADAKLVPSMPKGLATGSGDDTLDAILGPTGDVIQYLNLDLR
jgi:hypothetical protein